MIDRLTVENGTTLTTPVETLRYQYNNHLGTACLELDGSAAIISYEEYHPFGTTSYRSGRNEVDVSLKRYKYVGKERDEETGLYYYGARYYAAWLCRFVSVDPLQHKYPYYTPYQYAGNKPITYIDLDGLEEAEPKIGFIRTNDDNECEVYAGNGNWNSINSYDISNLYVTIRTDKESADYAAFDPASYANQNGVQIFASSFEEALKKINQIYGNNSPEAVMIDIHGFAGYYEDESGNKVPNGDYAIGGSIDDPLSIDRYDLKRYFNGRLYDDKVRKEIDSLFGIINAVQTDGVCVLGACKAANDELLVNYLLKIYNKKVNKNIDFYINGDGTASLRLYGSKDLFFRYQNLSSENIHGWTKINKNGLTILKEQKDRTGALIYDPQQKNRIYEEVKY